MKQNESRGRLVSEALAACPTLAPGTPQWDRLWLVIQRQICTRGLCLVTPLGSSSSIRVTDDHAMVELVAAMEWLVDHEREARAQRAAPDSPSAPSSSSPSSSSSSGSASGIASARSSR